MRPTGCLFLLLVGIAPAYLLRGDTGHSADKATATSARTNADAMMDADTDENVMVDAIVDMTDEGKKLVRPSASNPVYYLPLPVGYENFVGGDHFEGSVYVPRRPEILKGYVPSNSEFEALMESEFAKQGYRIMTHQHHPSLVLTFIWGLMGGRGRTVQQDNYRHTLLWGKTMDDGYVHDGRATDYLMEAHINVMDLNGAYFMIVSAYDFQDWLHHKTTLYWRAHVTTNPWGKHFSDVATTMVAKVAPMLGREMLRPQVAREPVGRVIVGAPVVKDFQSNTAGTPSPAKK